MVWWEQELCLGQIIGASAFSVSWSTWLLVMIIPCAVRVKEIQVWSTGIVPEDSQWISYFARRYVWYFLFPRGVHKDGFLQPHDLAKYHVVLTTYETLRKELNYADLNTTDRHRWENIWCILCITLWGSDFMSWT